MKSHIFYNRGPYDSLEVNNESGVIMNNLINNIIEYNKDKPFFTKYLNKLNNRIFHLRKFNLTKIKQILVEGFSKYSKKTNNSRSYASVTKNGSMFRIYDNELQDFIDDYYPYDPRYKISKDKLVEKKKLDS